MKYLLIIPLCFLAGCSKIIYPLDPGASHVQVVDYIKPELRPKLKEIDMVKCQLGNNCNTLEANIASCHNSMKNDAARLGGDIVYLEHRDQVISKPTSGGAYGPVYETNIIELRGIVYKIMH